MKEPIRRIEIAGGIASGKTTLAKLLTRLGLVPVFETFKKNPFYSAFYKNPTDTAFETEITYLLQHYHQIKFADSATHLICTDFSLALDEAYALVTLSRSDHSVFDAVFRAVKAKLPGKTMLIHLRCSAEVELHRIRRRRRRAERAITIQYLESINIALTSVLAKRATRPFMTIDSSVLDFAHDNRTKRSVLQKVGENLAAFNE